MVDQDSEIEFTFAPYRLFYRQTLPLQIAMALVFLVLLFIATYSHNQTLFFGAIAGTVILLCFMVWLSSKTLTFRLEPGAQHLVKKSGGVLSPSRISAEKFSAIVGLPLDYTVGSRHSRRRVNELVYCLVDQRGKSTTVGLELRSQVSEDKLRHLAQSLNLPLYLGPKETKSRIEVTPTGIKLLSKPNPMMAWKSENELEAVLR